MKVLFYLEPALFRDDPAMLLSWAGWVSRVAAANPELQISCASNRILVERLSSFSPVACHGLAQRDVSGDFGFDRTLYAQDLYADEHDAPANRSLLAALRDLAARAEPDLVVSLSQNRYLRRAFETPILFAEIGPLPRSRCRPAFFFDVLGHQRPNLLTYRENLALRQPLAIAMERTMSALYENAVVAPTLSDPRTSAVHAWLALHGAGKQLALLAMQPPGWLTYEGLLSALAPADLLMSWASQLPPNWMGVVSYHPAHRLPATVEQLIAAEHLNLIFLPDELASGCSEQVLPQVDAVVTVSSTVALQGALLGKRLVAAEKSAWSGMSVHQVAQLDEARALSEAQRLSLLFFLTNRYCHSYDRVLDERGYFSALALGLAERAFSPELYFDPSSWREETARELLSPAGPSP